jgi:hypothetical protein
MVDGFQSKAFNGVSVISLSMGTLLLGKKVWEEAGIAGEDFFYEQMKMEARGELVGVQAKLFLSRVLLMCT